jgi:hypothetical protein
MSELDFGYGKTPGFSKAMAKTPGSDVQCSSSAGVFAADLSPLAVCTVWFRLITLRQQLAFDSCNVAKIDDRTGGKCYE